MTRLASPFAGPRPNAPAVLWIVALTCLPEILLTLADTGLGARLMAGLVGGGNLRQLFLVYGAFWRGLLGPWEPAFALQPVTMFLSYALLHGGLLHLIGNMVVVLSLGGVAVGRLGQGGFVTLYIVTAIGGAAGFALLSASLSPMVGASGAVFGLIGAWQYWEYLRLRARQAPLSPVWRTMVALVLVNAAMWWFLDGFLAWEAHLGGFVAGWIWAALMSPRAMRPN